MTVEQFVDLFNSEKGLSIGGTLCIWGSWFGRPMDNYHEIKTVSFDALERTLVLTFNNNERLTIWEPVNLSDDIKKFEVADADKILWEWHHYGKPKTEENFYFEEYTAKGNSIEFRTNLNGFKKNSSELTINKPAIMLA